MPAHLLPRLGFLFAGIVLLSFAIALAIRSDIGTSPVSSVPYVYSFITQYSVGTLTIIMQVVLIFVQLLILGKQFQWYQWLQLPVSFVFGFAIDAMLWLTQGLTPTLYISKLLFCVAGCMVTAVAVCLMVKANLIMMAIDAVYLALSKRFGFNFGRCKMWGDLTLVAFAVSSIWLASGQIIGIGVGTVIGALLVGSIIRRIMPYFQKIEFKTPQRFILTAKTNRHKTA